MSIPPRKPPSRKPAQTVRPPDRYKQFMDGEITIDDLDEEEIMRAQFRNIRGDFRGRAPKFVPQQFAQEIVRKQHEMVAGRIAGLVSQAFDTLSDVMGKPFPQPGDSARVKAAQLVLERYLGRVPEAVNIRVEKSQWEDNKSRFIKTVSIGEMKAIETRDEEVVEGELEGEEDS